MKLAHEDRGQLCVLTIRGDFTGDDAEVFRRVAEQRMDEAGARDFVVDCREAGAVDSRGLEALLWLQETCQERLGQVRLAGCSENLRMILRITRLEGRLELAEDVDDAARSLG